MFLRTFLIHSSAVLIKRKCVKSKAFYKKFNNISIDIPEFSVAVLKRTFREHNIGYEDGFTCFITDCPFCNSGKNVKPKTYINKTTGMYMCSNCKRHGEWNELQACINMKRKRMDFRDLKLFKEGLEDIRNSTKPLKDLTESQLELILREFQLPVISPTSISNLDVRINKTDTTLYFPLENVESQIVGYRTLQSITNEETILPNNTCGGLLTAKMRRTRDTAVVVPNIADFLILLNATLKSNIICLPDNVNSLSQYFLPSFERFKKLILWLGADINSWNSAKHFAKKLGEKRCLFVRPNEAQLLPHLDDKQDFKSVIDSAEPIWHKSIITFAGLRSDVLSDLQNVDKVQGVKWKRYPTLNKILKGHRRGELTVITGPTGSGKTTFISEYSLDLAMQGVNTLWGSFEIRNARLAKTMLQQMALIPLDENLHLFDKIADKFEKLPIYYMTFHGQQSIKVVMEAVEHATYVHDISHVIIDNVQFMMGISEEQKHMDRFWKQDAIIASFRTFATRKNCHVTLVIHPRKERHDEDLTTSSIFGGAKASQEADNVLIIQDKRLTSIKGKKYLQVAKNRYSGDLGIMALDFDKKTLSFAPKKIKKDADEKACKQSRNEEEIIEGLDL